MNRATHLKQWRLYIWIALVCAILAAIGAAFVPDIGVAAHSGARPGTAGVPYANMPAIAPIGVRVDKYAMFPSSQRGRRWTLRRDTGYRSSATVSIW